MRRHAPRYLDAAELYRIQLGIGIHNDETIRDDFFAFLEERGYLFSYKMPFLLSLLNCMNELGEVEIERVLDGCISFYQVQLDAGLPVAAQRALTRPCFWPIARW